MFSTCTLTSAAVWAAGGLCSFCREQEEERRSAVEQAVRSACGLSEVVQKWLMFVMTNADC